LLKRNTDEAKMKQKQNLNKNPSDRIFLKKPLKSLGNRLGEKINFGIFKIFSRKFLEIS
jgi:hypothetical protein